MINPIKKLSFYAADHPWRTILVVLVLVALSQWLMLTRLTMNTSPNALFDQTLPFLRQDQAYTRAFPDLDNAVLVVIDAASAAKATRAADALANELARSPQLFKSISQPSGGTFFLKNGLLYLSSAELANVSSQLAQAQPMLGALTVDPSLRGLFTLSDLVRQGVERDDPSVDQAGPMVSQAAKAIGEAAQLLNESRTHRTIADPMLRPIDWAALFASAAPAGTVPRSFLLTRVTLDNMSLQPGENATRFIRAAAARMGLDPAHGYRVRLTGDVPLTDEEFATIEAGTSKSGVVSIILVMTLVFMALGSWRLVAITLITLLMGFVLAGGWAAISVGEVNLISIAFAVMFVGLAVDFGIQFCMRLREERFRTGTAPAALASAITITAMPLLLAGSATALGFFSFLPTQYKGVADLGIIAGGGIFIAYLLTITLLPALAKLINPASEFKPAGYQFTRPFNEWLIRQRKAVLTVSGVLTLAALAALPFLRFDFDPLKLKDPHTESMQTLNDMRNDPWATPYTVNVLTPSLAAAEAEAQRLRKLPAVRDALTLASFVPEDQDAKRAILDDLALTMGPALMPPDSAHAANGREIRAAAQDILKKLEVTLKRPPTAHTSSAHGALLQMAAAMRSLLQIPDDASLEVVSHAMMAGFAQEQQVLAAALSPDQVTIDTLPADLKRSWIAKDGRYRVQLYPQQMTGDARALARFVHDVRAAAPTAIGPPVLIAESGRLVTQAFAVASTLALLATLILLWLMLHNIGDVLRTMAPLVLAAVWTLGLCAALGFPITFANIIGLPLLLGIGVTYPIYHVIAWRAGEGDLLPSPMARGVFYSALTVMAAFGSLAISNHPGTAGMGKLLALALTLALIATFVVLPALLGEAPPEEERHHV